MSKYDTLREATGLTDQEMSRVEDVYNSLQDSVSVTAYAISDTIVSAMKLLHGKFLEELDQIDCATATIAFLTGVYTPTENEQGLIDHGIDAIKNMDQSAVEAISRFRANAKAQEVYVKTGATDDKIIQEALELRGNPTYEVGRQAVENNEKRQQEMHEAMLFAAQEDAHVV